MFHDGDFYCEVAKERIEQSLKAAEHDHLVKQVRLVGRSSGSNPRNGLVTRSAALLMTLFK